MASKRAIAGGGMQEADRHTEYQLENEVSEVNSELDMRMNGFSRQTNVCSERHENAGHT